MRFFTPGRELPMAGHPTIGAAFVLAHEMMVSAGGETVTIRLEEEVGGQTVIVGSGEIELAV